MSLEPPLVEETFGWHTDDYAIRAFEGVIGDVNNTVNSINLLGQDDPSFSNQDYINYQPVEFSKKQLENLSMSFGEEVVYGVGSFIPMLGEFAIINSLTAGTLGSLGLLSRLNSLRNTHYVSKLLKGRKKVAAYSRSQMQKRAAAAGYSSVDDLLKPLVM